MPNEQQRLLKLIKQAAVDAMNAAKPVNVCYGKVTNDSPLEILVDQKLPLDEAQLVLSRNVTDFKTKITMLAADGWDTVTHTHNHAVHDTYTGGGSSENHTHKHEINKIEHTITVHNGLVKGDEVILIRQQDGQKYIVWDRIE